MITKKSLKYVLLTLILLESIRIILNLIDIYIVFSTFETTDILLFTWFKLALCIVALFVTLWVYDRMVILADVANKYLPDN